MPMKWASGICAIVGVAMCIVAIVLAVLGFRDVAVVVALSGSGIAVASITAALMALFFGAQETAKRCRQWVGESYNEVEGGFKKYLLAVAGNLLSNVVKK